VLVNVRSTAIFPVGVPGGHPPTCPLSPRWAHVAGRMSRAVAASLRSIPMRPEDSGSRQLVKEYARLLDEATDPIKAYAALGPKLAAALRELGAPAAGPAASGDGRAAVAARDELRERRDTRRARAAAMDAAAT